MYSIFVLVHILKLTKNSAICQDLQINYDCIDIQIYARTEIFLEWPNQVLYKNVYSVDGFVDLSVEVY